ncbi:MAG: hypothetical protein ABW194_01900 [Novosphingobium sp.]
MIETSRNPSGMATAGRRSRLRTGLVPLGLALCLTGCARDVIIKSAAGEFAEDAGTAITAVSKRYDDVIAELNEQNVRFLTDNPACGLNTTIRLRTEAGEALLRRLARSRSAPPADQAGDDGTRDACLSEAEWALIDDYLDAPGRPDPDEVAPQRKLLILSRADFDLQLAAVGALSDYVAILADAADEPEATAAEEIEGLASGVLALGQGAGSLQQALSGGDAGSLSTLFAANGPIASFAGHLAELGAALEVIADQARDVKTLRRAILGPTGQSVPALMAGLAEDADRWGCIRYQARLGELGAERDRLSDQLPKMTRDQRLAVVRNYLQKRGEAPDALCGAVASGRSGALAKVSPVGQMFAALQDAHKDLERIAREDYTPAERRRLAAATMQRLGAVFKAIGSAALVIV